MKTLSLKVEDDLHKRLKVYAATQGKAMAEIIIELVERELETKKEQTQ